MWQTGAAAFDRHTAFTFRDATEWKKGWGKTENGSQFLGTASQLADTYTPTHTHTLTHSEAELEVTLWRASLSTRWVRQIGGLRRVQTNIWSTVNGCSFTEAGLLPAVDMRNKLMKVCVSLPPIIPLRYFSISFCSLSRLSFCSKPALMAWSEASEAKSCAHIFAQKDEESREATQREEGCRGGLERGCLWKNCSLHPHIHHSNTNKIMTAAHKEST